MMGIRAGAGGGLGHGISATLTRLLALTLLSASSDRIIHTESITLSEGKSATEGGGEKIPFLRCSWEPNNLLLSAVSSALDLPM